MKTSKNHISHFKQLALERLKQKQESRKVYPINKKDLLCLEKCPLCRTRELEVVAKVYLNRKLNFFTTVICANCLFTFRSVSPEFDWFKKCWASTRSEKIEVFNPEAETYKRKRYEIYKKLILPYATRGKLLDLGASYGTGTNVFRNAGFVVNAIEAEENKINYLKNTFIPVVATSIERSFSQLKKKYDVTIFSNCLEHLDNPVPVIANMRNYLRPNGIMLLSIPYLQDSINWGDALYLTHKSNFTLENIIGLLAKNGFEIIKIVRIPFFEEIVFIIRKTTNKINVAFSCKDSKITINKIKKLYHKDLPIKRLFPINEILKYTVPYVDQFFQTVNLDKNNIKWEGDYITFTAK